MKILNFTVIKLSACLCIGIVLAYYIAIPVLWSLYSSLILFLLLTVFLFLSRKQFIQAIWFGVLVCFTTISIGIVSTNIHNQKLAKNHYIHLKYTPRQITFRVKEILKPGNYKAIVSPSSGDLDIKLSSNEAPVELDGDIKLIKDWTYTTNIVAKSNEPGIAAMLNLAGQKQSNGSVLIKNKGDLSPFIAR